MRRIFILLLVLGLLVLCACVKEPQKPGEPDSTSNTDGSAGSAEPSVPEPEVSAGSEEASGEASRQSSQPVSSGTYVQISQSEAAGLMKTEADYILLDVRTDEEFHEGHIPGAICIPNETITDIEPKKLPDKDQLILVYCRSGRRSKEAAQKLADMGYTNIREFGGIIDWRGEVVKD